MDDKNQERSIRVRLNGVDLWWLRNADGSGALAPADHCDDMGQINGIETALFDDSYAHVMPDGTIWRYRREIGDVTDLQIIDINQ